MYVSRTQATPRCSASAPPVCSLAEIPHIKKDFKIKSLSEEVDSDCYSQAPGRPFGTLSLGRC